MIASTLLRLPRDIVRLFGLDIVRYQDVARNVNSRRLRVIRDAGTQMVIDVGAAEGNFGLKLRESGYAGWILSFEPLSASYATLSMLTARDSAWRSIRAAIGDADGSAIINVSGRSTSSSLLDMAPTHLVAAPDSAYVGVETVRLLRLDSALNEAGDVRRPFYLKIDVQGYEAQVLRGATNALADTRAVELEVSMIPLYEGSAVADGIFADLYSRGFRLVSWEDVLIDAQSGHVLQADCIFVR